MLRFVPARADGDIDPPAAHLVDRGHELGEDARQAEGHRRGQGTQPDRGRLPGQSGQHGPGIGRGQAIGSREAVEVIRSVERLEAGRLGSPGQRQLLGIAQALLALDHQGEAHRGQAGPSRDRGDPLGEGVDRRSAVQGAKLEVVGPHLAAVQEEQLAPLAGVPATGVAVRARLHGHRVGVLAHHLPDGVVGELVDPEDLVDAQADGPVDDRHGHGAGRLGDELVLEARLGEARDRIAQDGVALGRHGVVGGRRPGRDEQLASRRRRPASRCCSGTGTCGWSGGGRHSRPRRGS